MMLFSATFPPEVQELANDILRPNNVFISNKNYVIANRKIIQQIIEVPHICKREKLLEVIKNEIDSVQGERPGFGKKNGNPFILHCTHTNGRPFVWAPCCKYGLKLKDDKTIKKPTFLSNSCVSKGKFFFQQEFLGLLMVPIMSP